MLYDKFLYYKKDYFGKLIGWGMRGCGYICWVILFIRLRDDGSMNNGGNKGRGECNRFDDDWIWESEGEESIKDVFKFLVYVFEWMVVSFIEIGDIISGLSWGRNKSFLCVVGSIEDYLFVFK